MQLIRCTGKLQKEMGLKASDLSNAEPSDSCLGPWHANLIYIDRRKCVLFVNDRTLFNFIVPDVSRPQIRNLANMFRENLQAVVASEGFSPAVQLAIRAEYREVAFAKSSSKSVLGSMNDLAFHYTYHVLEAGGVHSPMIPDIIKQLNRMPMGPLEYVYAIEELKSLYEKE